MLHGQVLLAFLRAGVAHVRAGLADHARELAAARHVAGGEAADGRTVEVELDAAREHPDVLLVQARGGAVIAGHRAGVAGVDAGLELLMWHKASEDPRSRKKRCRPRNRSAMGASKGYGRIRN